MKCLEFEIPAEQMAKLEAATAIEMGFPHDFLTGSARDVIFGGTQNEIVFRK